MSQGKDQEIAPNVSFVGYQDTFYSKGYDYWIERGMAWKAKAESELPKDIADSVQVAHESFTETESTIALELAQIDMADIGNLDKIQALMVRRAIAKENRDATIAKLTQGHAAEAFESEVLNAYDVKVSGTRGSNGSTSLQDGMVYPVKGVKVCDNKVRHMALQGDSLTCYAVNGKSSEVCWTIQKDGFSNVWPTSKTGLQRLHYGAYHTSSKTFADVSERLNTANALADWKESAKRLGIPAGTDGDKAIGEPIPIAEFLEKFPVRNTSK